MILCAAFLFTNLLLGASCLIPAVLLHRPGDPRELVVMVAVTANLLMAVLHLPMIGQQPPIPELWAHAVLPCVLSLTGNLLLWPLAWHRLRS